MTLEELINKLDPAMHAQLKRAIELGKWPDGGVLSPEDREMCMQAVIAWEQTHLPEDQRVGYMHGKDGCTPDWLSEDPNQISPLKWDK